MPQDAEVIERLLNLLREWGWEAGFRRLEEEIESTADPGRRAEMQQFLGWIAAERGHHEQALDYLQQVEQVPELRGWSLYGQAFVANRRKEFTLAHAKLDQAGKHADGDSTLQARLALVRGSAFFSQGQTEMALPFLAEALELVGQNSFGTGRVLDAYGMVYAGKDNFHAAREFYLQALDYKERFNDQPGLALTHGQLGRLYLDWGQIEKAEKHFRINLDISRSIRDPFGEALMYNHLGQTALQKGDLDTAAAYLDECIQRGQKGDWPIVEGYGRKDRALAYLAAGEPAHATREVEQAERLFQGQNPPFTEGLAHARRVRGMVLRAQGEHDEAEQFLRQSLQHFETHGESAEVARTWLELARTLLDRPNTPRPLKRDALLTALARAEACRRSSLVQTVEGELRQVDEAAYWRQLYRRVRGSILPEDDDASTLLTGRLEPTTVMFLDVKDSTKFVDSTDAQVVMMTMNQLMAEMAAVVRRREVIVNQYQGDGFMAVVRGEDHAGRAVLAALDLLRALEQFNKPRRILKLKLLEARIGMHSGSVCFGNLGTYDKMDFTAIGSTAHLAKRIEGNAETGVPCISAATHQLVKDRFVYKPGNPRVLLPSEVKGFDEPCPVWDVVGRKG